jgi:release factor glutamine methyltransferase
MEAARALPSTAELVADAAARLAAVGVDTARLDAELLLADALALDRSALLARWHDRVDGPAAARFSLRLARRLRREPVAYILGRQEFWSLPFAVTPAVLIPRPETELVVETASALAARLSRSADDAALSVCDIGTGSGCIAVAVAREIPRASVVAIDRSCAALAVARENARANRVASRITFVAGDLLATIRYDHRFDLIVSNPPYVRTAEPTAPEVAFEPALALAGGDDGLAVVRRLIAAAPARLQRGGWLVMEIGTAQEAAVRALAAGAGLTQIAVRYDLAGLPRVLVARAVGGDE